MSYSTQLCGFKIQDDLYSINVEDVQEVVREQVVTPVPLADEYIRGLMNLRGKIVTAISLRKIFGLDEDLSAKTMNIIVRKEETLLALVVDEICDVMELQRDIFEKTPNTIDENVQKFAGGVYKLKDDLLVHIDLDKIFNYIE